MLHFYYGKWFVIYSAFHSWTKLKMRKLFPINGKGFLYSFVPKKIIQINNNDLRIDALCLVPLYSQLRLIIKIYFKKYTKKKDELGLMIQKDGRALFQFYTSIHDAIRKGNDALLLLL